MSDAHRESPTSSHSSASAPPLPVSLSGGHDPSLRSNFPVDRYTPHGYLDNPYDAGPWAGFAAGGVIRSADACGFGWFWPRGEHQTVAVLRVGVRDDEQRLLTVQDFDASQVELESHYHSSRVHTFDFNFHEAQVSLAYLLAGREALLCRASLQGLDWPVTLIAQAAVALVEGRNARAQYLADQDAAALLVDPGPWYVLRASHPSTAHRFDGGRTERPEQERVVGAAFSNESETVLAELDVRLEPDSARQAEVWIAFGRGATAPKAVESAGAALESAAEVLQVRLAGDDRFWSQAPLPVGDWPAAWRRGWVYDLETTRLMLRPPAGAFNERWPTWHLFWPRVVLAENALDMLRLAYADPAAAQAALLTVFRDADRANVPCMFVNGSLNMVAEGGDACGTSPAWCLPFHNIYLLYQWQPDRAWLREIYPYLEAYLQWWTENRRDAEGWFVYRCTWESGEDSTPRLDPEETGHGDIFDKVRPVELQAAMAHSARILIRLGRELELDESELSRWGALHQEYTERTRSLWDAGAARFRDAYPPGVAQIESRPAYWEAPADGSPLQLLPLMYGVASRDQAETLASQLEQFNQAPWRYWASWTYTVVEAARAVGAYDLAGRVAYRVLSSVYPRLDRRDQANVGARPGTSCEWWPDDLAKTTVLNESYGWGATTATLFLRHVFGFGPSPDTANPTFELAPSVPEEFLAVGRRLGFRNIHYRGQSFGLLLEVGSDDVLTARLEIENGRSVTVEAEAGQVPVEHSDGGWRFEIRNRQRYLITIVARE